MIKVLFMGRKHVAATALHWLVDNGQEIVGVVTDAHLPVSVTGDLAKKLSLPLYSRHEIENMVRLGTVDFDLGVSVLYWQKIREPVLSAARKGVLNFHPAPLPLYKGTAGYNLAILEGLDKWAVSAHYADANIDTGPIIDVSWFEIESGRITAQDLERQTQPQLLNQIKIILHKAIASTQMLSTFPNEGGRYVSRLEMEEMKAIGPGDDIDRKIRAFWFPPYNGAHITLEGKTYTLIEGSILSSLADPTISSLFTPANSNDASGRKPSSDRGE